tara:strand:+ start:3636 stop:3839 length:204 start_codon:yes stop_codon:yes gene_type:complete
MGEERKVDSRTLFAAAQKLSDAILSFEQECLRAGAYMPALATRLRVHADELADKYPDDTNEGSRRPR